MEEEIDLKDVIHTFWEKRIQIILIILLFIVVGTVYETKIKLPKYSSSTTLALSSTNSGNVISENKTNTITTTDITLSTKLISTYSELIKSNSIIRQVKNNINLNTSEEELKNDISVDAVENTSLIKITVTTENPEDSAKIANELAKVFIAKVQEIYNMDNVHVVDIAKTEDAISNMNYKKDILLFALVGIVAAVIYVFLANLFDTTIKSADEIEKNLKVPVLNEIPKCAFNSKEKDKELVTKNEKQASIAEIFRTLRTNIQFMNTDKKLETLLITSTFPGEGKSWVSSNLAVTFAQTESKVILVDADMRKGRQYTIFGMLPSPGLSNCLEHLSKNNEGNNENTDFSKYIQHTEVKNLDLMSAGNIPPNPSELLTSHQMTELLEKLKKEYDLIIIDGTPCEIVTDAVVLSRISDLTLVVTAYKETRKDSLSNVVKNIKEVGGRLAGIVINKTTDEKNKLSTKKQKNIK